MATLHNTRHTRTVFDRRRRACCASGLGLLAGLVAPSAGAAVGGLPTKTAHSDLSPEWEQLRGKLFQSRAIESANPKVQLIAPLRAPYGASVPVKIVSRLPQSAALYVKKMYLLVDKNPSMLAAVLELTPEVGQADFETRLRVDEYSHVRVISELSNGELHMDSRYVKTSGGCSAPPNRSNPELIGKTVFKLPSGAGLLLENSFFPIARTTTSPRTGNSLELWTSISIAAPLALMLFTTLTSVSVITCVIAGAGRQMSSETRTPMVTVLPFKLFW